MKVTTINKSVIHTKARNVVQHSELILGFRPANERRRNKVTLSLIGWAQT